VSLPDDDGDGFCNEGDVCPGLPDPAQLDHDGDGVGDLCQCTDPAPGRCIAGGGSRRTDCQLEISPLAPTVMNRGGTRMKPMLRCRDGDLACDLDAARDGRCTFGLALCFGNSDPRYPRCTPAPVETVEILGAVDAATAAELEGALRALGLGLQHRRRLLVEPLLTAGPDRCTPMLRLIIPAPSGRKAVRRTMRLRALADGAGRDTDRLVLVCE
jgi:hypothetical protein